MAKRKAARTPLCDEIRAVLESHPAAAEWSVEKWAQELGRNQHSIKVCPEYRKLLADRQGSALAESDRKILAALTNLEDGDPVPSDDIASELDLSQIWVRRKLSAFTVLGYTKAFRGTHSGYRMTDEGRQVLKQSKPKTRRPRR